MTWVNKAAAETQADPEFAGSKFEASRVNVARAIQAYGNDGLGELLKTPLGMLMVNSKAMWSFLAKAGANVAEDGFVGGRKSAPKPVTADDFYRETAPKGQ